MPKYTFSKKRIIESTILSKYLFDFIKLVPQIRWDDYTYNGPIVVTLQEYIPEEDSLTFNANKAEEKESYIESEVIIDNVSIIESNDFHYELFGGCVYELLNNNFNNYVDLHKFTDKTGDVDVKLYFPIFDNEQVEKKIKSYIDEKRSTSIEGGQARIKLFKLDETLNPCFLHYADWLMDELMGLLRSSEININESIAIDDINSEYIIPNKLILYKHEKINNMHIISIKDENMFKIQIVIKIYFKNTSVVDHILEFVANDFNKAYDILEFSKEKIYSTSYKNAPKYNKLLLNGLSVNIQTCSNLFSENYNSYKNRKLFIDYVKEGKLKIDLQTEQGKVEGDDHLLEGYNSLHKAFNHVSRILYLLTLVKMLSQSNIYPEFTKSGIDYFTSTSRLYWIRKPNDKLFKTFNQITGPFGGLQYYKISKFGVFKIIDISTYDVMVGFINLLKGTDLLGKNFFYNIKPGIDYGKVFDDDNTLIQDNEYFKNIMNIIDSNYNNSKRRVYYEVIEHLPDRNRIKYIYREPSVARSSSRRTSRRLLNSRKTKSLSKRSKKRRTLRKVRSVGL